MILRKSFPKTCLVITLLGCAAPSVPSVPTPTVLVYAKHASYSPGVAGQAIVSADIVFLNKSDHPARLGCALYLERDTGSGFEVVDRAACLGPVGLSQDSIFPNKEFTVPLRRDYQQKLIDGRSRYRFVTSLAFAPDFKRGVAFSTEPFTMSSPGK